MAVPISNDLMERIFTWYYTYNRPTTEKIRDLARCSIGLISNVIRNYQEYNNESIYKGGILATEAARTTSPSRKKVPDLPIHQPLPLPR